MQNFWTFLSFSSFHFFHLLSPASTRFPARQVFDTKGSWDFFPFLSLLWLFCLLTPLPFSLKGHRKALQKRWCGLKVQSERGWRFMLWSLWESFAHHVPCTSGKWWVFCMAAWPGCVPKIEKGTKLQFFKRSFFGCWSGPAEAIKGQVLKLLLGD